jgi:hypothetical protein
MRVCFQYFSNRFLIAFATTPPLELVIVFVAGGSSDAPAFPVWAQWSIGDLPAKAGSHSYDDTAAFSSNSA